MSDLELHNVRILEICEEVEIKDSIEFFGPQIELNLENSTELGKPPVEVTGVAPTAVVEVEEESSVEVLASVEKKLLRQSWEVRLWEQESMFMRRTDQVRSLI